MTKFRKSVVCRTNSFSCQLVSLIYLHNLHCSALVAFAFLQYVLSNGSTNGWIVMMHSQWLLVTQIAFVWLFPRLNAFSNRLAVNKQSRSCCICLIFLNCLFSNAASNCLYFMKYNYTHYMITCWNGFTPECGVVVFYVISQIFITYLPHQIQLR